MPPGFPYFRQSQATLFAWNPVSRHSSDTWICDTQYVLKTPFSLLLTHVACKHKTLKYIWSKQIKATFKHFTTLWYGRFQTSTYKSMLTNYCGPTISSDQLPAPQMGFWTSSIFLGSVDDTGKQQAQSYPTFVFLVHPMGLPQPG